MTKLINFFATSAYRVMASVRRLDKVHNNTVLASVSRRELIYTLQSRQLRFLGHLLCSQRDYMFYINLNMAVLDEVVLVRTSSIIFKN